MNRVFEVNATPFNGGKRRHVVVTTEYLVAACELLKAAMDVSAAQFDNRQPPTANDIALLAMRIADSDIKGKLPFPRYNAEEITDVAVDTSHGLSDDGSGGDDRYKVESVHYAMDKVWMGDDAN